jgi:hypothetical protein
MRVVGDGEPADTEDASRLEWVPVDRSGRSIGRTSYWVAARKSLCRGSLLSLAS